MGLAIGSDIALGMVQAADPQRAASARAKLAAGAVIESAPQAARVRKSENAPAVRANVEQVLLSDDPFRATGAGTVKSAKSTDAKANAASEFEAFILQSFIQEMLPKDAESVFGKGTAGSVWRSMLSEKIAKEVARAGGIGIAERLGQAMDERARALPAGDNTTVLSPKDVRS